MKFWEQYEEERLGKINAHKTHERQEKQRKTVSNLLDNFEEMGRKISLTKIKSIQKGP